jgi:hypothetical protein
MRWQQRWVIVSCFVIGGAAFAGACGDDGGGVAQPGIGGGTGSSGSAGNGASFVDVSNDTASAYLLSPQDPVVIVKTGQPLPTVDFDVTTTSGAPVSALWLVDRAEIGSIDASGLFTASGNAAGKAKIEATVGSEKLSTTVTVKIEAEQNGGTESDGGTTGGGEGGVGGEGEGGAIDVALRALLEGAASSDPSLAWLYPYDKTVFPLGLLPPLIQWNAGAASIADGIYIHLSADNYDYKGFFGRPKPLSPGSPFVRHPIPKQAWDQATLSAAGGNLTLSLVVAAGGVAYGPITQSWKIAKGRLKGTVYYQSYGTNLAKNYPGAVGGGMFGGATLAIKPGATDPTLVAGQSGGSADCRVCHSVSADGSRMIVQHGNVYQQSSSYDLNGGYAESVYPASTNTTLGWIGMSPDGSIGLGNALPLPGAANSGASTAVYDMTTGNPIASSGLTNLVTSAGLPAFSPDGKQVVFNFYSGPGDATIGAGDGTKLVVMDFDQSTMSFSNARLLHQSAQRPGWASFFPTGKGVVFQAEVQKNTGNEHFATRNGAKGELWWVDVATATARALERANGKDAGISYLPTGGTNHGDDSVLNYEPTVSPVASGGYAWIVFLSRRLYGNVATIDPWASDPRDHDLTATATTKKLWVAAVDLDPAPGTDPSHPAFYLPGQELLAGNARGFWVVDPCKPDGADCSSGDECCGGFCQQDPQTGALSCGQKTNECSAEYDKCTSDADCCDPSMRCVNGRCSMIVQ